MRINWIETPSRTNDKTTKRYEFNHKHYTIFVTGDEEGTYWCLRNRKRGATIKDGITDSMAQAMNFARESLEQRLLQDGS
jgi:hypothetical protein